jgi:phage terminase large subunit-like protein
MLGFAPADYQKQLEINSREKGIDAFLTKKIGKLKQKYYIAKREGDFAGMQDFKDDLLELGAKHPELGINNGSVGDILSNSLKAQERATKEMIKGVRYNKKRLETVKASQAEYED